MQCIVISAQLKRKLWMVPQLWSFGGRHCRKPHASLRLRRNLLSVALGAGRISYVLASGRRTLTGPPVP